VAAKTKFGLLCEDRHRPAYGDCQMIAQCEECIKIWIAATESAKDKIVELYAEWHIAHKDVDATAVNNFVDWVQKRLTEE
jgi:hypothetical protein